MAHLMYRYWGEIDNVYDGDTFTAHLDLGFHTWLRNQKFRLGSIDTPEIRTKDQEEKERGYEARDYVRRLMPVGLMVPIRSLGKGKYGRWIADVSLDYLMAEAVKRGDPIEIEKWMVSTDSLSEHLVLTGHAERVEY